MEMRTLGKTGLTVSVLGLGAGQIGDEGIEETHIERLLNAALDQGITLIDTARGYGLSEERIGQFVSHRRGEYVLSTKVGYGIPGHSDWTYGCIIAGVNEALRRLRTDHLDIVHLHSCPLETLQKGEVIDALDDAVRAGKARVAAYSGENDALKFAAASGRFSSVMASLNICDQRIIDDGLLLARERDLGFIAKRSLANTPWKFPERPHGQYVEEYWLRFQKMGLHSAMDWDEVAVRFSAFSEGVSSAIIGTTDINHLRYNIDCVGKGPLPRDMVQEIRSAFRQNDEGWIGQV